MTRLFTWARHHKAVAAISVAGFVAAGFLVIAIASDLRGDAGADRVALESLPFGPELGSTDVSQTGNIAPDINRTSRTAGTSVASSGSGKIDTAGLSPPSDSSDYVDTYIAGDSSWRDVGFKPLRATGGERRDGDSAARDVQDKEVQDKESETDEVSLSDEEQADETYPRNEIIAGRVISESGMALVGVGVTATATHLYDVPPEVTVPPGDLQRYAVSDTAGHYRFEHLAAGEYRVNSVPTEIYGMTQMSVRSGVDFADIVVKTQRQLNVVGVVTDTMGQPLAGALVQPQALGERGAYTDSAGHFELQLQIPEQATGLGIRTELYGYRGNMTLLGANQVSAKQSASVTIELEALEKHAVVTGILRSADDGQPVARKTVQLYSPQSQQRYHATSNIDGRFIMTAVEADERYELLVAGGGGYAAYMQPNVAVSQDGLELELMLVAENDRTLAGRMVNLNGTPIPNFSLIARAAQPPFQSMRVTSDAGGNFVLRNPPQSPLVFESQSIPHLHVSGVQVPARTEQTVSLTLDIGRDEIYGFVVDANGEPVTVPNVVVSWQHSQNGVNSSSTRRATADSQGGFTFRELGPGVHTIIVNATGYKPARVDHDAATQGYEFVIRLEVDSAG